MTSTTAVAVFTPDTLLGEQDIKHKKFAVTSYPADGLGDLVAGVAVVRLLQERGVPPQHIVFCTRNRNDMRPLIHQLHGTEIMTKEEVLSIDDIAMHIIVPVPIACHIPDFLATGKPIFVVSEYGFDPFLNRFIPESFFRTRSLGVASERRELGICTNRELVAWSQQPDHTSFENKVAALKSLSYLVQFFLLKAVYTDAELLSKPSIESLFFQNRRVYFGYASQPSSLVSFLLSVASLPGREHENIVMILPKVDSTKFKELLIPFIPELLVHKITFSTFEGDSRSSWTQVDLRDGGRHIALLSGIFSQEDVVSFLKCTEEETIATGDQSMSLALSAGKCVVYEARPHKKKFADDLRNLLGPSVAFEVSKQRIGDISTQKAMYRSYFLQNKEPILDVERRLVVERDFRLPFVQEMEHFYQDWLRAQGAPPGFVSLAKQEKVVLLRDIPFDIPTLLSSDQTFDLPMCVQEDASSSWDVEDYHGFSVVVRKHLIERDHMLQAASSEHHAPST